MQRDALDLLQRWYAQNCDGDWEHGYGVRISNIDNPGWTVSIDLTGTDLCGAPFGPVDEHRDENDWLVCRVVEDVWEGVGGPRNLLQLVGRFLTWAGTCIAGRRREWHDTPPTQWEVSSHGALSGSESVLLVDPAGSAALLAEATALGWHIAELDAGRLPDEPAWHMALAEVLGFPNWYGRNWDAFTDCLRDLAEWSPAPGHLLVVHNAPRAWRACPRALAMVIECWLYRMDHQAHYPPLPSRLALVDEFS